MGRIGRSVRSLARTAQSAVEQARDALQGFLDTLPADETPSPPAPGARPFTILLVEDNVSARAWVRLTLAEDRFALLEAANGREALLLAERESLDLAIVDLNLGHPGPDSPSGFKLLQLFKHRVPTLVLTVDQRPQSIQRAIEAGAWGYLVKSPDPKACAPRSKSCWHARARRGKRPPPVHSTWQRVGSWRLSSSIKRPPARRSSVLPPNSAVVPSKSPKTFWPRNTFKIVLGVSSRERLRTRPAVPGLLICS